MGLGFALFAGSSADIIRTCAREAEALGYSSFWVNHPGPTDGLAALALGAAETQRIELGIGVIPLHTRGPADIFSGVLTQKLPVDRLLLGVGSPNPGSLQRVRSGVADLRSKLSTRIIVAALGPKMCHLAGEVADGVLLNWVTPEYAKRSADIVRAGAAAANRQPPKIFAYVRLAMGGPAAEKVTQEANRYARVPAYGANFERMGVKPVDTAIILKRPSELRSLLAPWRKVVDEVVFRAITGAETVEEHVALVQAAKP